MNRIKQQLGNARKPRLVELCASAIVALGLVLFPRSSGVCTGEDSRPNILLIMSDDHGYQAISAYGSELIDTPSIDRIAIEGVRFDRCYVTNSICGPSRACMLTGKYSHKNGYYINDQEFDISQPTFPALLRAAGYQTAVVGKWHLGRQNPTGFDYWNVLEHQGYYYQPKFIGPLGQTQHVGYVTSLITDYTLGWLQHGRQPDKPFLLLMHHKAPHRPWDPALEQLDRFRGTTFPEPATLFDDYANRASAARKAQMTIRDHMSIAGPDLKAWDRDQENGHRDWFYAKMLCAELTKWKAAYAGKNAEYYDKSLSGQALVRWKYQRYLEDYLSCVASIDDSVGKILDYLDTSNLARNTVVIYCSDQGMFLGEHGWFDKRFMYEQSLRTPLLIRWPNVATAGHREQRIVSNVDFAPTLLQIAGAEVPPEMQGRSLLPLLRDEAPTDWRNSFYYHYYEGFEGGHSVCEHYGVTTGDHKLIHFYKLDEWELFDLHNDPQEMRSVYDDESYRDVRRELKAELGRRRKELGVTQNDPVISPSP
jgi:arylsulfatase A-like enzyme